ncbi:hypothetical protein L208DRAFT_1447145 [Tricholoma matsutake]|nr:hypothetical protein L208DRAFT_1447145 [Tricholoma matsutake 945]
MLDSSPVALPPIPRPLKRSASTASLPTPPRTRRKRKNGRSRASNDSDTDLGSLASDSDVGDSEEIIGTHKKPRTSEEKEAEEEAFWMNASSSMLKSSKAKVDSSIAADTRKAKSSAEVPPAVLYRRLNNHGTNGVAPVSPPPSNRKPTTAMTTPSVISPVPNSPPVTPESKFPMRDSPNNPFLESSRGADSDSSNGPSSSEPRTPHQEKPTVTYVFRGVRGTFPNPMYDQANKRPISPSANSRLPIDHPDYSPAIHCPPKLLFPGGRKAASARHHVGEKRNKSKKRALSISGSDDERLAEDSPVSPIKLDFGGSPRSRRGATATRGPTEPTRA